MDYKQAKKEIETKLRQVHIPPYLSYFEQDIKQAAWVTHLEGGDVVAVARAMLHKERVFNDKLRLSGDDSLATSILEDPCNTERRVNGCEPDGVTVHNPLFIGETVGDEITIYNKL